MSMINDALRRASNVTAPEPMAETGAVPPPLPAAAFNNVSDFNTLEEPPPAKKTSLPLLLLALFLFCAAAAAGVYLWERNHRAAPPTQSPRGQLASTAPTAKAVEAAPQAAPAKAASTASPAPAARSTTASATATQPAPTAPAAAAAVPAANVTFPPLRLQSIYYKPANPSVMINGHTLYVNDLVQGVTVAAIDPSSVTLVLSGRTNVLTLR